jgi:hypothetical protein
MAKVDRGHLHDMWELMPAEIQEALKRAIDSIAAKPANAGRSVVRSCPRCAGRDTTDCHEFEGIADPTVCLCVTCGYVWCIECDTHLISTVACGHWKICANCSERKDESGYCGKSTRECRHIIAWKEKNNPTA